MLCDHCVLNSSEITASIKTSFWKGELVEDDSYSGLVADFISQPNNAFKWQEQKIPYKLSPDKADLHKILLVQMRLMYQ